MHGDKLCSSLIEGWPEPERLCENSKNTRLERLADTSLPDYISNCIGDNYSQLQDMGWWNIIDSTQGWRNLTLSSCANKVFHQKLIFFSCISEQTIAVHWKPCSFVLLHVFVLKMTGRSQHKSCGVNHTLHGSQSLVGIRFMTRGFCGGSSFICCIKLKTACGDWQQKT